MYSIDITVIDGQHYLDLEYKACDYFTRKRAFRKVPIDPVTAGKLQRELHEAELDR